MKRQISEAEKREVLARQGRRCFIDNAPLGDDQDIEFDHINPFAEGGSSEIGNIGAACKKHNHEKGKLSLSEYRDRLALRQFFEGAKKARLDDLLESRLGAKGYGLPLDVEQQGDRAILYLDSGIQEAPLATCPATQERYFFAMLPVSNVRNDAELQPRPLEIERVWELYKHLRSHTQLAPAVCRLVGRQALLFDGQHKAAAQVWAGRTRLDCKVYLEPEVRRLKETNLSAHDRLRQMPFYTSFIDFMRARANLTASEAGRRVRSLIYRDIIEHPRNEFRDFIEEENRGRKNPITLGRLEKSFFAEFIAAPPLDDEFETEAYHRDEEREHVVRLLNLVVSQILADRWAPERNDSEHRKAARLFSAGSLRAWVPFLREAVAPSLRLYSDEDRRRVFYRELDDTDWQIIERLLTRLISHKVWVDPDPALGDLRYDNAQRAKDILKRAGLTPGWILGAES